MQHSFSTEELEDFVTRQRQQGIGQVAKMFLYVSVVLAVLVGLFYKNLDPAQTYIACVSVFNFAILFAYTSQ